MAADKAPVKRTSAPSIEKISETIHSKLQSLGLEPGLQADIEWCLGSYRYDGNPSGLYEKATAALKVFREAQQKKVKGVTAKLIADIEKAIEA